MRKTLLYALFLALVPLVACHTTEHDAAPNAAYPQTWQLINLTGQLPGSDKTNTALPWQETYVFQGDSTFLKTRRQGQRVVVARGTFSVQHLPDGRYLVLTYAAASSIIGSCTAEAGTETLFFQAPETLSSTWQACDGPGLEYRRVKVGAH